MSSVFSKLDPNIITFHILPHLDGKTLIILSSVSSQFKNLICENNNSDLWRNICTSTWPSIPNFISGRISNFPGGYRNFFSDVFPPIHPPLNINPSPPPSSVRFFYCVDIFLNGEPQPFCSIHSSQQIYISKSEYRRRPLNLNPFLLSLNLNLKDKGFEFGLYRPSPTLKDFIKLKKQGYEEYLKQNLTFSCVVIETNVRKRAGSLFTPGCKPVSVKPDRGYRTRFKRFRVVFKTWLPSLSNLYTQMVKCRTTLLCKWQDDGEDKFCVLRVYSNFKDMNGEGVSARQAAIIILNAIENGERKNKLN